MTLRKIFIIVSLAAVLPSMAASKDPTSTHFTAEQCLGSAMPYPSPRTAIEYPDTLTPVMINHVGRHGARYPASPSHTSTLLGALHEADSLGTITPLGRELMLIAEDIVSESQGKWGMLDSLGMAEQCGIAARMYASFPELFQGHQINAISSYVPRCVMSMYEFTHQISRLDSKTEITTAAGRKFSPLLRFFDHNADYRSFTHSKELKETYLKVFRQKVNEKPLRRILGEKFPLGDRGFSIAMAEYSVLSCLPAIGGENKFREFMTEEEMNAVWQIFNLRQYLTHSASTLSTLPADIAAPLLENLISTTDEFIRGNLKPTVNLRFGHAETLMPLLALMRLPGCHYLTTYFDTVGRHWQDFHVVPMASNLQLILFRSDSGKYYLRTDLNEVPVNLIPGSEEIYIPWAEARLYMLRLLPAI